MNTLPINPASPDTAASAETATAQTAAAPPASMPAPVTAEPLLLPAATPEPIPTPSRSVSRELAKGGFGGVLGTVDVLSEAEEVRFDACETAIQAGWRNFLETGVALGEIRDSRLYRNTYNDFDDYCQSRWGFKRGKAHYLISAAGIYRTISATSAPPYPDHEAQLRPLIAVTPDNAQLAWNYAVRISFGCPITARMMKRAVKDLNLTTPKAAPAQPPGHQTKRQIKCLITDTMDEFLSLITRHAEYPDLLEKLEVLSGQLRLLFQPERRRKP